MRFKLFILSLLISVCSFGQQQGFFINNQMPAGCPDADVTAYCTAASITDQTYITALCTFVTGLKSDGTWNELDAFYILGNGSFNTCKYNLKNVALYTLTESGTITYTTGIGGGAKPNSGSYLNTNFDPSTASSPLFVTNSAHLMLYPQENINETSTDIGRLPGYNSDIELYNTTVYSTINFLGYASYLTTALSTTVGMFISNRTSSTSVAVYQDGSSIVSGTILAVSVPPDKILIFTSNLTNFSTKKCVVASIGGGISNPSAYNTRVHTFLTAIGLI